MRLRVARIIGKFEGGESGIIFLETLAALALLGIIVIAFLSGLATASKAVMVADERTTAESLAQSQMEWAKNAGYEYEATEYSPAPLPSGQDYVDYSATIAVEPLRSPGDGIQKITVTIRRAGEEVIKLEGYKLNR